MERLLLFIYNLLFILLALVAGAAAIGRPEPITYIQIALSTSQNRLLVGIAAVLILIFCIYVLISFLRVKPRTKSVAIEQSLAGNVSITIPAIKVIIMKAVKSVDGIREIKPEVDSGIDGVRVYLHMMINPDISVPLITKNVQEAVRKNLEEIGGLKVAEVKVLVDDLNPGARTSSS